MVATRHTRTSQGHVRFQRCGTLVLRPGNTCPSPDVRPGSAPVALSHSDNTLDHLRVLGALVEVYDMDRVTQRAEHVRISYAVPVGPCQ